MASCVNGGAQAVAATYRPNPVATGQLCADLHAAVLERKALSCANTRALDWVQHVSARACSSGAAIELVAGAQVGWRASLPARNKHHTKMLQQIQQSTVSLEQQTYPHIQRESRLQVCFSDRIREQGWLQVQHAVPHERVASVVEIPPGQE